MNDEKKESLSAAASLMQPRTPEEQKNWWSERKRGVEVVITPELANDPKAAKMIKLMEATGATIHIGCSETMDIDGNIAQAVTQKQLSDIRMLMHNGVAGAFRSSDQSEPVRWRGETELSRFDLNSGIYERSPMVKTGAIDFDALLDPQGILAKTSPARERMCGQYGNAFHHYTPEYLRERAMTRKAKRLKNQRRRRNAKARRK
ncbi:hypothetical protein PHOBOS_187 [Erwinia phage vB_EamM_Phobos]|uniref:hypothetical protein n=1 Tax=Erwinia phage vB_EamM_Phobos TaxID=1883377 RepID=UPI00081C4103|nr:hypothetical protein BIZ79_gp187 [Erwinia phage vB_EamM_Phobos]ANZ50377.1 hypothetical protein PHOBOS_187 [Erwinia phage vB_EamM_Phobos]